MFRLIYLIVIAYFVVQTVNAQSARKLVHEGNKLYNQKKYNEAEIDYRKSINTKEKPFAGNYNLGNTFYKEGKFDEAKQQFETASGFKSASREELAKTYHNLGNSLLKSKKYEEGIAAYKQALKINPKDNDTRYNLAYAQAMLQQQQQQQDKNQDQNKDQKKDQDKKDQQEKKEQQKEQQQKQEQAKQDENKKPEPRKDKISKEDAEKILQALNNDEKKTQKKLNIKEPTKVLIEKEW